MQSNNGQETLKPIRGKNVRNDESHFEMNLQEGVGLSSSLEEDGSHEKVDTSDQRNDDLLEQLVLNNPSTSCDSEIETDAQPIQFRLPAFGKPLAANPSRVLPSVGAFTVQCATCFKWRLIPTKEKYEAIRESILQQPFYCETAREWRPDISCDDPTDISQDGSRIWAIDKPNISKPPTGWQRLLHIRGEGSTRFADVYYQAPSGKRLRSMVEIQKFLAENPKYTKDGVTLSQFSFQIPKPLQENYVRKRPLKITMPNGQDTTVETGEGVNPQDVKDSQLNMPTASPLSEEDSLSDHSDRPAKRQVNRMPPLTQADIKQQY